jgi:hypothetical protein
MTNIVNDGWNADPGQRHLLATGPRLIMASGGAMAIRVALADAERCISGKGLGQAREGFLVNGHPDSVCEVHTVGRHANPSFFIPTRSIGTECHVGQGQEGGSGGLWIRGICRNVAAPSGMELRACLGGVIPKFPPIEYCVPVVHVSPYSMQFCLTTVQLVPIPANALRELRAYGTN